MATASERTAATGGQQTELNLVSRDEIAATVQRITAIDRHLQHLEQLLNGPGGADVRHVPGGIERYMDTAPKAEADTDEPSHARRQLARQIDPVRHVLRQIYFTLPVYLSGNTSPGAAAAHSGLGDTSLLERVAAFLLGLPEISRRVGVALAAAEARTVREAGGDVRDVLAGEWPASFVRAQQVDARSSDVYVPVVPGPEAADRLELRNEWGALRSELVVLDSSDDEADEQADDEEEVCLVPDHELFSCAEYVAPSAKLAFPAPDSDDSDDDTSAALSSLSLHISSPALQKITAAKEAAAREAAARLVAADRALRLAGTLREPRRRSLFPSMAAQRLAKQLAAALQRSPAASGVTFPVAGPETGLSAHDFETLVLPRAWLNDAIVDSALSWLDQFANERTGATGYPKAADRSVLVLGSFFFATLVRNGGAGTERALRRKGVTPAAFAQLETVLIPVCQSSHWTLLVVQPAARRVAHMDSLNPRGTPRLRATVVSWLVQLLAGEGVAADEWTVVDVAAPVQTNGYDCGVFTVLNALCVVLGVQPEAAYSADEMPRYRWEVAAMLVNQGFTGEFDLGGL